jgi:hypothetical protein
MSFLPIFCIVAALCPIGCAAPLVVCILCLCTMFNLYWYFCIIDRRRLQVIIIIIIFVIIIYYSTNVTCLPSYVQQALLKLIWKFLTYTQCIFYPDLKASVHRTTCSDRHWPSNCWWKLLCFRFVIVVFNVHSCISSCRSSLPVVLEWRHAIM